MCDKSHYISALILTAAAAVMIAAAPAASAVPVPVPPCVDAGGSTICQTPGNAQISTAPTGAVHDGLDTYGPFFHPHR